ncbi:MAG: hypothetical protein AAF518_21630 [Spirochaetota bacterium]
MSSDLYLVAVEKKTKNTVVFQVSIIHPDAGVSDSNTFTLRLLFDFANPKSPFGSVVDVEDYLNEDWVQKNAAGFIKSVQQNTNKKTPQQYRFTVVVYDPIWIEHIQVGQKERTTSYDSGNGDPWRGEPLRPEDFTIATIDPQNISDTEGMVRLGSEMFSETYIPRDAPKTILLPFHGRSKYQVTKNYTAKDLNISVLKKLLGLPVLINEEDAGSIVQVSKKGVLLFRWSVGYHGTRWFQRTDFRSIGVLRFKDSKSKMIDKPKYEDEYRHRGQRVEVTNCNDRTVELKISRRSGRVSIKNKTEALALLATSLEELRYISSSVEKTPLYRLLEEEEDHFDYDTMKNFHAELADVLVESVETVATTKGKVPRFDSMDDQSIIDFFENPTWPTLVIRIVVYDKAWIKFLKEGIVFNASIYKQPKERPRQDSPWQYGDKRVLLAKLEEPWLGIKRQRQNIEFLYRQDRYVGYPRYVVRKIHLGILKTFIQEPVLLSWEGHYIKDQLGFIQSITATVLVFQSNYGEVYKIKLEKITTIGRAWFTERINLSKGKKLPKIKRVMIQKPKSIAIVGSMRWFGQKNHMLLLALYGIAIVAIHKNPDLLVYGEKLSTKEKTTLTQHPHICTEAEWLQWMFENPVKNHIHEEARVLKDSDLL